MNTVFSKWKDKLLDLGKNNPLINFKESKVRSLKVIYPNIQQVYTKITSGNVINFYDTDLYIKNLDENINIDDNKLVLDLADDLKKNELLVFNKHNKLSKVCKNLKKLMNNSLEEKGLNILYVAFGFLKWQVKDDNFFSPLVLVPIQISGSNISIYEDDEIVTNPTLLYKLKRELNIDLQEFNFEDDNVSALYQYLTDVKNKFADKGWEVVNDVYIDSFSFLKINMYKDYEENEDIILKNENVAKLLNINFDEKNTSTMTESDIQKYFKDGKDFELHNIVDADSSQLEAIIRAKNGESFVLQGPPGTGKSQTITNLIAEALYDGKKILFVSEKLAALNVVYNKLKLAGLEDFCLELHSYKTNKKNVINELYRVSNKPKSDISSNDAKNEINELLENKEKLDEYCKMLHSNIEGLNITPYQIINKLEEMKDLKFDYIVKNKSSYTESTLNESMKEIDNFVLNLGSFGGDYRKNYWYGYLGQEFDYESDYNFRNKLQNILDKCNKVEESSRNLNDVLNLNIQTINDCVYYTKILNCLLKINVYDKNLLEKDVLTNLIIELKKFNEIMEENTALKNKINSVFNKDVYALQNPKDKYFELKNKYKNLLKRLGSKYKKIKIEVSNCLIDEKHKLNYKEIKTLFYNLSRIEANKGNLKLSLLQIKKYLSSDFVFGNSFNMLQFQKQIEELNTILVKETELSKLDKEIFNKNKENIKQYISCVISNKDLFNEDIDYLQKMFDKNILDFSNIPLTELIDRVIYLSYNTNKITNYLLIKGNVDKLTEMGILDFVTKGIDTSYNLNLLSKTFYKLFLEQYFYDYQAKNPILKLFTKDNYNNFVKKFQNKDKLKFEISKAEIISKLNKKIPSINNSVSGSQLASLIREANKKKKQKSVRSLIAEMTELVQTIKPCFLMSPLSVSTFLVGDDCKFDLVIFDEASQIFPWDSIGAIYRGKQVIIVGDSKQMPPSNFFNSSEESEEYQEDESLDFESILDLATSSLPQTSLKWHYRSKTEELIAFSNKHFYDDKLYTFPSVLRDNKDMGIDFYYVEDGVFDRKSKTNEKEAIKIVELVKEHYKNYPDRSLGIVAFSISQQELIEDKINEEMEKDVQLQQSMSKNIEEPFFIKNLETVQGDERDTIIFSIAYAKDKDGKFILNFGPLNKKGGERRLNVAVTRAKCNVKLVASITDNDIDLNKTESIGTKLLKEYIYCARYDMSRLSNSNYLSKSDDNYIIKEVEEFLNEKGYETERNVGYSEKKIDLVVKQNGKYLLAVEGDGNVYKDSLTTRDRERLREEVLNRMGWKYFRILSLSWYKNNESEKNELLKKLTSSEIIEENDENIENLKFLVGSNCNQETLESQFEVYEKFNAVDYCKKNKIAYRFDNVILEVVKHEQPVNEKYLLMMMLPFFVDKSITPSNKISLEYKLKRFKEIVKEGDYYYINGSDKKISLRIPKDNTDSIREIGYISNIEIEAGILKVIELNIGIDQENLIKTITKLLGFKRVTDQIKLKLNVCIDELIQSNKIILQEGKYILC